MTTQPKPFTHRDGGTDERTWLLDTRWDAVARLDLDALVERGCRFVLVAPHPDDESLALGGTLADLAARGTNVTVVVATHGGDGPAATPRRAEAEQALAELGAGINTVWWDLPDGGLPGVQHTMTERLIQLIDADTVLLAPVEYDGHTDHEAVAHAAYAAARRVDAILLGYAIWLWHWATPDDVDWSRVRTLAPSLSGLRAKSAAVRCHRSQLISGDGFPIVGPAVLDRAGRVFETVFLPADDDQISALTAPDSRTREMIAAPFDTMLEPGVEDPWHLDDSIYERRRLALVLACLGRDRYQRIMEIGCATGQLAEDLRERADQVVGVDASARALAVARTRSRAVQWVHGAVPADFPDVDADVIVLSEIGYFLDGPDLLRTLRAARRHLRPHGEIVIADWLGDTSGIPLDGAHVHAQAATFFDLPLRARYQDADLVVEVWGEPVSVHREYSGAQ